jgi:hypothetical protein
MLKEDLLEEGRLSAKAAGVDLESLVPPSMQAVVQAQIDQLPTAPGVVLRWASVWGDHFHTGALLDMLPKGLVCGLEGLEEQLEVLMDAHMIQRADKFECSHSIGGHAGDAWQVNSRATLDPHCHPRCADKALSSSPSLLSSAVFSFATICSRRWCTPSCPISTVGACTVRQRWW